MKLRLKNILIVVRDLERSRSFYRELFGLETVRDGDGNVILTEGLVLQEAFSWKEFTGKEPTAKNHAFELYFEERDLEGFAERLERYGGIRYESPLHELPGGKKTLRFYDPDGNLIEVGTPG